MNPKWAAALAAALCAGCATHGTISLALDELGSEQRTDTSARGIRAKRAINMTGISGPETVGMLVTDPDPPAIRLPSFLGGDVLPDTLAVRISTDCSKIAVQEFPAAGDKNDVVKLRDVLDRISDRLARKAVLELRRTLMQRLHAEWIEAIGDAEKEKAAKAKAATLFPADRFASADAVDAALQALGDDTSGEIGKLIDLIDEDKKEQATLRAQYGLVVTQWSVAAKRGFWASLGANLGFESGSESSHDGVLIMAGLRVSSLVVGDDFWWRLSQFRKDSRRGADAVFDGYVVTHQLAARRWAYSERTDFSRYLKASIDVSRVKDLLGGGWADMVKEAQVRLKAEIATAQGARNIGALDAPIRRLYEFRMTGDRAYLESVIAEAERADGFKSIYTVRTELDKVRPVAWDGGSAPTSDCSSMQLAGRDNPGFTKVALRERLSVDAGSRVLRKLEGVRELACVDLGRNLLNRDERDRCNDAGVRTARGPVDAWFDTVPVGHAESDRPAFAEGSRGSSD